MSYDHPITDVDLRRALVAIADDGGGSWRGTPVAFADRLMHRFDLSHQPVTVADLATVLLFFLRSILTLTTEGRFAVLGGAAAISIETQEIAGRATDLVVVTLVSTPEEVSP